MDEKNRTLKQEKSKLQNFEKNEKQRDQAEKLKKSFLQQLKKLTGEDHYVGTNKGPFAGEPFNQVMHKNSDLLNSIGYLTQAEESFLEFKLIWNLEVMLLFVEMINLKGNERALRKILSYLKQQLFLKLLK